ncbi:FCD domain-containing protein [Parasalinivibrio latis]|uniref:FCD domain-containing protein n=1 Tax=Parasalinivibrio latis TaxID=2952610 RepID=UPI0030E52565
MSVEASPAGKPVVKTSGGRAADDILATLEQQIVSGALKNGEPLPSERAMMEMFGASRTVIREVIVALDNRGLITNKARFRPVVKKPDYETVLNNIGTVVTHFLSDEPEIKHLYDMRIFVEKMLVREAAINANKEHIRALKDALAKNGTAIGDPVAYYETDKAFHRVLYQVSNNPIFPAIHQGFCTWLAPQWEKIEHDSVMNMQSYSAHQAIFQSILERDPDAAEQALVDHLNDAWMNVRKTFD